MKHVSIDFFEKKNITEKIIELRTKQAQYCNASGIRFYKKKIVFNIYFKIFTKILFEFIDLFRAESQRLANNTLIYRSVAKLFRAP